MSDHDCNELEQVGKQGPYALLEAAVKRIEEKDALIRKLQEQLAEARSTITYSFTPFSAPVIVMLDDIPAGFYEGEVVDEAPDTRDPDDYEDVQDAFYRESWGFDPYGYSGE